MSTQSLNLNPLVPTTLISVRFSWNLQHMLILVVWAHSNWNFWKILKNKKNIFLGTFIPSRTVQKIPTGHVVPSRNMQLHFCTEKGEKICPATGPVPPSAHHAHCTVYSAPPAASIIYNFVVVQAEVPNSS
jgi:hypothetical protein